eukprot:gnl/MRDRNA2_/MRDRNA2_77178_c0_seq2.p1 gnl/MRDRNA2_/MRDRNA2_77178_c0~~gnl/MRDRNA2_/MRDRNA2_77178_c0_seq2.p1  ORF type:complete len:611 (-),score=112.62 gnl/MRDRNA2_/MRDRNA2_77178_c0_seq2:760-2502(-)
MEPPDIPEEFYKFGGKIYEVNAEDDNAGAAYSDIFARSRFDAAFPEAHNLPMLVGLDLEWKPDRNLRGKSKQAENPIALVQLACWDTVLLIRTLGCDKMPQWLQKCFEDRSIIKVSASFDVSDMKKLNDTFGWDFVKRVTDPRTFIDIAHLAKKLNLPYGLKRLAYKCGVPMSKFKEVGCSNWAAARELTSSQRQYAADDAFFTLYLLCFLFDHAPPPDDGEVVSNAYKALCLVKGKMADLLHLENNTNYRRSFFELRAVIKDTLIAKTNALGSGGSITLSHLGKVTAVKRALKTAAKASDVKLTSQFIRANEDLFVIFFDKEAGELKVRPRQFEDEEDTYRKDDEDEWEFVERLLERLAAYKPPEGCTRLPMWVPSRAILSANEKKRWEQIYENYQNWVETNRTSLDGTVLRLLQHPRAANQTAHLWKFISMLHEASGLEAAEAEQWLRADSKFANSWQLLNTIENGTKDEAIIERALRARTQILIDAHQVARRVSVDVGVVRDAIEKLKWYSQVLGRYLSPNSKGDDRDRRSCLDAIVESWPTLDSLPKKRSLESDNEHPTRKRARPEKGKSRGKDEE